MRMRDEDFPDDVKQKALNRAGFRCQRCWGYRDLEFHHRIPVVRGGRSDQDNCTVLCSHCHRLSPSDLTLFESMFLRFASPKEMIQHYGVENEDQAIDCLCEEYGLDTKKIHEELEQDYPSHKKLIYEGMAKRAMDGKLVGLNIPYGYNYADGELEMNTDEARIVGFIFAEYLEGSGTGSIVKELNAEGIPTKHGRNWAKETIAKILKNSLYCGFVEWDGILSKSTHEPLVDIATFNKVQQEIVRRIRRPRQKYEPRLLPEK